MEEVAVYGYITPLKVKIILAITLSDAVVRDADVISVCLSCVSLFVPLQSSLQALLIMFVNVYRFLKPYTSRITTPSPTLFSNSTHLWTPRTITRRFCSQAVLDGRHFDGGLTTSLELWAPSLLTKRTIYRFHWPYIPFHIVYSLLYRPSEIGMFWYRVDGLRTPCRVPPTHKSATVAWVATRTHSLPGVCLYIDPAISSMR